LNNFNNKIGDFFYGPLWPLTRILTWPGHKIALYRKRRRNNKFMEQFIVDKTFVAGCGTEAMLVQEIDQYGDLSGMDLFSGGQRSIDAHHCLDGTLTTATALTIMWLGDEWSEARCKVLALLYDEKNLNATEFQVVNQIRELKNSSLIADTEQESLS
jgi:hypothetical protein